MLSNVGETTDWGDVAGVRSTLPPKWVDTVDQIDDDVRQIMTMIKELSVLHGDRVNAVFEDSTGRDEEIEGMTKRITGKFRAAERRLKTIASSASETLPDSEAKVRSNIQRSVAKKLQELSLEFRKSQKKYLNDVRAQKSGGGNDQFGIDLELNATGGDGDDGGAGFTNQQLAVVDDLEGVVNERDKEIQNIAKSIEELNSIFKELAVLVIDQGTILGMYV